MSDRAILHIDMDAFFAAVEVLDDPGLAGLPVVVGGTPEGRGVVAAASYEARKYGIHSAMSAARAIKLCPQAVFLRGRHGRYGEVSKQIFAIYDEYTPLVEHLSIDEAFLDVTGCRRLFGSAEKIGHRIKQQIRDEVGLVASVGVAHNKFLAKLASDLDKPDGFFVFSPENCREILAGLPVGRLWGVGKVMQGELERFGIRTVGELQAVPRQRLVEQFGDHAGRLSELAVGYDERSVVPYREAKSIGHEVTFAADIADAEELREVLDGLAAQVARRLRRHGLVARTVNLKARYSDFTTLTRAYTLPEPTDATTCIRDTARELLTERLGRRGRPLRLIGVSVSNLEEPGLGQGKLFRDPAKTRERTIDRVLDELHGKYGSKIQRGTPQPRDKE
ncbi:MAG: DNA polymerase IV [bacterium]